MTETRQMDKKVRKQQRKLRQTLMGILVAMGLPFCAFGLAALAKGEVHGHHHARGSGKYIPVSVQGAQARVAGASCVAIGGSLLLSLLLVPHAVDAHFRRSGLLSMPLRHLALFGVVSLLLVGGVVGVVISFTVK